METAMTEPVGEEVPIPSKRRGRPPGMRRSGAVALHREIVECTKKDTGMSNREIADKIGCDKRTVGAVLAKYGIKQDEVQEYRENRADIFAGKQKEILHALTLEKLQNASVKDLTIAFGTIYDKERLESGMSTHNVANLHSIADRAIKTVSASKPTKGGATTENVPA